MLKFELEIKNELFRFNQTYFNNGLPLLNAQIGKFNWGKIFSILYVSIFRLMYTREAEVQVFSGASKLSNFSDFSELSGIKTSMKLIIHNCVSFFSFFSEVENAHSPHLSAVFPGALWKGCRLGNRVWKSKWSREGKKGL